MPQANPLVMVGFITTGLVKDSTMVATFDALWQARHDYEFAFKRAQGCYVDMNRNNLFMEALRIGAERLVFIDWDMYFKPEAIGQLLAHDWPIVGVNYHKREPASWCHTLEPKTTLLMLQANGRPVNTRQTLPADPFKVAAVGTGFMSIHVPTIARTLDAPYFRYDKAREYLDIPDGILREDTEFCIRAGECGLDVWCDPTIPMLHIGDFGY